MCKFFVEFGLFGRWFETYEEAEEFCCMAGINCENIRKIEEEEK